MRTARSLQQHELLAAAQSGDSDAFVRLVYAHRDSLRALAFSVLRDASVLDDVMQDAFIKGFRSVVKLRDGTSFRSWIHRIVYTTALDETRRRGNIMVMAPEDFASIRDDSASVGDTVANRFDINAALFELSESQRAAVLLVDGYGFDLATAAEVLQIPPGTAASRVRNGRTALKSAFSSSPQGR